MACCLPSIAEEDEDDGEEHFPTLSLDDDVWMEEPVPEWHLCIHENSQCNLCPYLCPYSLSLLHLTQEDAPYCIDLNNIFKLPDFIVTTSNEDAPSLEDILGTLKMIQTIVYKNLFMKMDTETNCGALLVTCDMLYDQGHDYK